MPQHTNVVHHTCRILKRVPCLFGYKLCMWSLSNTSGSDKEKCSREKCYCDLVLSHYARQINFLVGTSVFLRHVPMDHLNTNVITVTQQWARWRLKSPTSRLFAQPFVQVQIKEELKAPGHWPLWRESTGDRWIPLTKGQYRGKWFHMMRSSWLKDSAFAIRDHTNSSRLW